MGNSTLLMSIIFFFFLLLLQYFPATSKSLELLPPITFSSFNKSNTNNTFHFSDVSSTSQGALQVTPDTSNNPAYLVNKSGRVLYNRPFTLWTTTTEAEAEAEAEADNNNTTTKYNYRRRRSASFNTSFTINIFRVPGTTAPGEGFAFLIAPSLDAAEPPTNSHGGYLGLTNQTLDSNPANHLVAVEFDTVKQPHDPDANHVGLDINSVVSNATSPLAPFGIDIAPANATNYTVWIDYDGLRKRVSVRMARQHSPKPPPGEAVLDAYLDTSEHVLERSYFGFAASTGATYQLNCVLAWNLTVEKLVDDDESHCELSAGCDNKWPAGKLAVTIGLPAIALVVVASVLMLWRYVVIKKRRRRRKVAGAGEESSVLAGTLKSLPGTPREFEFKVLRRATHEFDEKMKLGQGGFGVVYKGVVPGENTAVAVKKFSRDDIKGQDDFLAELSIINRLRHKHLVRLLGWCHRNGMLLLVYEFMPNGSLEQHLFGGGPERPPLLTWAHRYNILAGVASALHYLHNEYDQMVVHRDIKSSNVLLDSNFNARLGDFGLARAVDTDKTSYVDVEVGGVAGTMGYIAPECFHTGRATRQSDVFAFGALVLEVVCSRRPRCDVGGFQFLVDWVWMLHREDRILEAVDPRLAVEEGDFPGEDAVRLLLLGLACSHPSPTERPKTAAIVHNIVHSTSSPPLSVPPFKPSFVWPSLQTNLYDDDDDVSRSTDVLSPYYASSPSGTTNEHMT